MKAIRFWFVGLFTTAVLAAAPCHEIAKLSDVEVPFVVPAHRLHNPVKEALAAGKVVYGNEQLAADIPTSKTLGAGSHFVWMRESLTPVRLESLITATHGTKPAITIVELERFNSPNIKPILGLGALGIAARVQSPEEAKQLLASIKFPPAGVLGLGPDDTTAFLADAGAASTFGNQARMGIAIIDSKAAAASAETLRAILKGFDAVRPDVTKLSSEEVARVEAVARELDIPLVGEVDTRDDADALARARKGYRMQIYGSDVAHVRRASKTYLDSAPANPAIEAAPRAPRDFYDNPLAEAVAGGKLTVGFYSMGHDPLLTREGAKAGTGMNFVWFDGEHRPLDNRKMRIGMEALEGTPAVMVARVPHHLGADPAAEARTVRDFVRMGVRGLVQPNVSTPEEARQFIESVERETKALGLPPTAVMKSVMIETKEGLDNIDAILDVVEKHKDSMWVHLGPFDLLNSLKARYGEHLTMKSPEFLEAKALIERKTRERGIALGGLALSRAEAQDKHAQGYRVLTVGSDQEGINAGINRFLSSNPHDHSKVHRELLVATFQSTDSIPWKEIPHGRMKTVTDPDLAQTTNYLEIEGDIDEGPFSHSHMQKQTTYLIEGEYEVEIGGEKRTLKAGDAVTIPPGVPHTFTRKSKKAVLIDVITPGRP